MLNAVKTKELLKVFAWECYEFWGNKLDTDDDSEVWAKVIRDLEDTRHDPFSPKGEELDVKAKEEFIEQLKKDLGGNL